MGRRTYSPEQIINKLREVEVFIGQGATAAEASRKVEMYVRWCFKRAAQDSVHHESLPASLTWAKS